MKSWDVYWNEYSSNTYLYGSEIEYKSKDNVEYRNRLLPPGTIIKQWYSKVNYQMMRIEPSLPIIDGESSYEITVAIDSDIKDGFIVRILYYDKYENEVGSLNVSNGTTPFRCPLKTYSYLIQLINAGSTRINFHKITITEK